MFSRLDQKFIFVTGPHRAGTKIAARMIAADTGHDLVLETEFTCSNIPQLLTFIQSDYGPVVIQCPFLCHIVHDLDYIGAVDMDESLIVMMVRDIEDIQRSEEKAKFSTGESVDFVSIGRGQKYWSNAVEDSRHIAQIKYDAWDKQKQVIPHWLELEYESLRAHELWRDGRDFSVLQTNEPIIGDVVHKFVELDQGLIDAIRAA